MATSNNNYPNLQLALKALRMVRSIGNGDYDSALVGVVGEVYAEDVLGMKKAKRGTKGIDGHIKRRSLSVKAKESDKPGRYISIAKKWHGTVDDVLVVVLKDNGDVVHYGPVPMSRLQPHLNAKSDRLSLSVFAKLNITQQHAGIRWK